jgi:hypothetical protein
VLRVEQHHFVRAGPQFGAEITYLAVIVVLRAIIVMLRL